MIKFFRSIRQQLLSQNRFSKYMLYAVGEIILVVIGILIALQINNWNETQKTIHWERRFLTDLLNEVKTDYEQLSEVYKKQSDKRAASLKVLELIENNSQEDKGVIDSIYTFSQQGNITFFPTTGVYDSGTAAGKIENIKNDNLKYAIMNLYNRYYNRLVYNGEVLDGVVGKVDWEQRKYFNNSTGEIKSWEAIQEYEFSGRLRHLISQNEVYSNIAKRNLERMREVITLINQELNIE